MKTRIAQLLSIMVVLLLILIAVAPAQPIAAQEPVEFERNETFYTGAPMARPPVINSEPGQLWVPLAKV
jgi:hypothetical protein